MTSEEWKEKLPLIQAYVSGETIQYYNKDKKWEDLKDLVFTDDLSCYRIKPKDKYRPFKDEEECFNEMMNHHPFGWVRNNESGAYNLITSIDGFVYFCLDDFSFDWMLIYYSFADGTPFGIKTDI